MTQTARVLAALTRAGDDGISAVDFAAPNVCDGGKPIMRVAARVKDLRDEGFRIETDGERNGCAVYKLRAPTSDAKGAPPLEQADSAPVPSPEGVRSASAPADQLFDVPAMNDMWRAA